MSNQAAPSDSTLQGQYAGFVTRLFALVVDLLLVLGAVLIMGFVITMILRFFNLNVWLSDIYDDLVQSSDFFRAATRVFAAVGGFWFVFLFYYILLLPASAGVTVGKALMGVRVVRMDGTRLTATRSTRRYVTFWLAALPLFLGLLWVIVDDRRQGWHDKLSGTCVIYDWPAQEDDNMLQGLRTRLRYMQEARSRGSDEPIPQTAETGQRSEAAASAESLT